MGAEEALEIYKSKRKFRPPFAATFGGPDPGAERALEIFKEGEFTEEDLARRFVGQESIIAGDPLPASSRFWISLMGDTEEERQAAFNQIYPSGEMLRVPSTDIVLYRTKPDENFRKVDTGFMESVAAGGGMAREALGDIAEIAGSDAFEATFEVIAGRGAGGFVVKLLKAAGGAGLGTFAQEGLQKAAGTQREEPGQVARRAAGEAGISIVGGTVGAALGAGVNVAGKGAIFEPTPEGAKAFRAARRLRREGIEVEDPLPIQVIDVPIVRLLGRQSAALVPTIGRAIKKNNEILNRSMRSLSNRAERARIVARSVRFVEDVSDKTRRFVQEYVKFKPKNPRRAAEEARRVVNAWWESTGRNVDELYDLARAVDEPSFDLAPALNEARRLRRGVRGAGQISEETGERLPPVQTRDIPSELDRELRKLERLDPSLPSDVPDTDSPVGVLREIRSNLSDLALPDPAVGPRRINRDAARLIKAIDEVLDNPTNLGDGAFASRWRAARKAASKRFSTREQIAVADLLRTERLSQFGESLARPGAFDSLVMIARTSGNEALNPIRDAFRTQLITDPFDITKTLDSFDKPTLGILMDSSERKVWREAGKRFDDLNRSNLRKALDQQTRLEPFIESLIDNPSTAGIDALARMVSDSGGTRSPLGRSLRASIMDTIWKRAHVVDQTGFRKLSSKKLNTVIDDFNARGVLQFLELGEKKILRNIEILQRVAEVIADAGTSIQAASAAAGIRTLDREAVQTVLEQIGVGRLMTTDAGRRLIVGIGKSKKLVPSDVARLLGSVAATLGTEVPNADEERLKRLERFHGTQSAPAGGTP